MMNGINTLPKAERKTSISSVKSREQLLEGEADYFAHEMRTMKQRRTKIIATMCEAVSSVDDIKSFLKSGMDIIRVNMAYCNQKTLEIIMKNKAIVEKELGCFIPILLDLKGTTLRLGSFDVPAGEISLKKGEEFRVTTNKKIRGNQHVVACDCSDLGKLLRVNDKLLVDYGRDVLIVKRIEKESETIATLKEKYPKRFDKCFLPRKLNNLRSYSHGDTPVAAMMSNEEDASETSFKSKDSLEDKDNSYEKHDTPEKAEGKPSNRRKFEFAFKKKKKAEKDVVVCEAESDCVIQSAKPVFIHQKVQENSDDLLEPAETQSYCFYMEENQDETSIFPVKDIKDLNLASKLEVDSVAITGVRSRKDVEEARFLLGAKNHVKIITKIQNASALENFDDILDASDGIIIARNYLSLHIPVEKLFFKQKEMIKKCHEAGKPVTIASQVLESMVRGLVPTTSEINDIANLILDGIDCITLVTETTYGLHKNESLETLSRICFEIEYNEVINRKRLLAELNTFQQVPNHTHLTNLDSFHASQFMPRFEFSPYPNINNTVAACAIKAVYDLHASLIVAFTQTGSTVQKLSKMRSPCPIIAVTVSEMVARQVSLLASVTAVKVGSMYGKEGLTQKVLTIAKEKNWVKTGDFIVITFGDVEGVSGSTNSLKIIKV